MNYKHVSCAAIAAAFLAVSGGAAVAQQTETDATRTETTSVTTEREEDDQDWGLDRPAGPGRSRRPAPQEG
jgi:hypothetical protein